MEKMLAVDKLARPADHILLRTERAFKGRIDQGLSPFAPMPYEDDFLKSRMHGICAGEFQAMEAAGRTLFDFPDAPWEFQLDMARQVWDESRHAEIYMKLLEYTGSWYGEFPEGHRLWSCTESDDPAARVAGINRGLEGLACDVFEQLIRMAQAMGDKVIERSIDYVLADEITHVRMGSRWMRKLTEGDPERLQRALEFQERFDQQVGTNGRALPEEVEKVKQIYDGREIELEGRLAIAREARLQAGFTEEEIEKLVHPTVSREKMLRDRGLSEDEIAKMLKGFGKRVAY
ncbi:MAG TPA: DUF455 family protein [Candidatus Binataceae bacterium]|nr:DUF455 family protein [Candidatus Binataceae bacterium]